MTRRLSLGGVARVKDVIHRVKNAFDEKVAMTPNGERSESARSVTPNDPDSIAPPPIERIEIEVENIGRVAVPVPIYHVWEITEEWAPLQIPIFHDILDYLYHDRYLEPKVSRSSARTPKPDAEAAADVHVDSENTSNSNTSPPAPEPAAGPKNEKSGTVPGPSSGEPHPVIYKLHTGPLLRPRMCIIVQPYTDIFQQFRDLERHDIDGLVQHWKLPEELYEIMSFPDLNPGFSWQRMRRIDGELYHHTIFCYTKRSTLATSYRLKTKETRGFWFTYEKQSTRPVLHKVRPSTPELQHPLYIHRQLLDYMVNELALISRSFLDTLISSINDLNSAFRSHDGGFEDLFLKASKSYLYARRSVFAKLDEAACLIQLMRDSLAQLEAEPGFWASKKITLRDLHAFLNDRLELSEKRLERFRKAMAWRDEQLQNNFGILHDLINMRDGRVSKAIAETSEQIARESKRDSSAMKTLAVLTTVFLPPTFIATLFSTPLFKFSAPGGSNILSSEFWIYWVVSIPLTIIVILIWAIWYRWSVNRHRIEDEQESVSEAIFGALDGTKDPMELEFEFVRKSHLHRKKKPSPLLSFLAGGKRKTRLEDDVLTEEDASGATRQRPGFWQRLLRKRRNIIDESDSSGTRSLRDD